jgi:non-ribosomal peptide synthetase component F
MNSDVVHRLIEQQAATQGDAIAYDGGGRPLTYRDMNGRANAVARALVNSGLKRGAVAAVHMARSADLVVAMLAILKAGAAYMQVDDDAASWPCGISVLQRGGGNSAQGLALDLRRVFSGDPAGPNLPILTRGSDLACVLLGRDSTPGVLIPHSTITALQPWTGVRHVNWSRESGAFDVWLALMNGATVTSTAAVPQLAA